MKEEPYENNFAEGLEALRREDLPDAAVKGFEHEVWTEIALRERRSWWAGLLAGRGGAWAGSVPVILAVALGALLGLRQAENVQQQALREREQAYVSSIHPVLMSETGTHLEVTE